MVDIVSRKKNFEIAFKDAPVTGYLLECGVGRGTSLRRMVSLASPKQLVFGFDSFEGLPEDWKMNDEWIWPTGSFAEDEIPEIPGAELHIGWFTDTLPIWKKEHAGRIALLHIDSDLYSSCVTVLEELNNQIVPGTVIVSDDHFYKASRPDPRLGREEYDIGNEYTNWEQGQYKAFNEWLKKCDRKAYLLSRGIAGQAAFRILQ